MGWFTNTIDKVDGFFYGVQEEVTHDLDVLESAHEDRNAFNECPEIQPTSLGEMDIDKDGDLDNAAIDQQGQLWEQRPEFLSLFHEGTVFTHPLEDGQGAFECEYDENGQYQPGGTFNYVDDNDPFGHTLADVLPHGLYGGNDGYTSPDLTEVVPAHPDPSSSFPASPEYDTPDFTDPDVGVPLASPFESASPFDSPSFATPAFDEASFSTPTFESPSFDGPAFDSPSFDFADLDGASDFDSPSFDTSSFDSYDNGAFDDGGGDFDDGGSE